MNIFLLINLAFGVGMIISDSSVGLTVLYMQTADFGPGAILAWGVVAVVSVALHFIGLLLRSGLGLRIMEAAWFGGFFVWLWAILMYTSGGFIFQTLAIGLPNLLFWAWYGWQWRKRSNAPTDKTVKAFV